MLPPAKVFLKQDVLGQAQESQRMTWLATNSENTATMITVIPAFSFKNTFLINTCVLLYNRQVVSVSNSAFENRASVGISEQSALKEVCWWNVTVCQHSRGGEIEVESYKTETFYLSDHHLKECSVVHLTPDGKAV